MTPEERRERQHQYQKVYYQRHRAECLERMRQFRERNPTYAYDYYHKTRRHRLAAAKAAAKAAAPYVV